MIRLNRWFFFLLCTPVCARAVEPPENRYVHLRDKISRPCVAPVSPSDENSIVALLVADPGGRSNRKLQVVGPNSRVQQVVTDENSSAHGYEVIHRGCDEAGRSLLSFRSLKNGMYVRGGIGRFNTLGAVSASLGEWETFKAEPHPSQARAVILSVLGGYVQLSLGVLRAGASRAQAVGIASSELRWTNRFERPWTAHPPGRGDPRQYLNAPRNSARMGLMLIAIEWQNYPIWKWRRDCTGPGDQTLPQLDRMVFGPNPSVRDWYLKNSNGRFTLENAGVWGGKFDSNGRQSACRSSDPGCDFMRTGLQKTDDLSEIGSRLQGAFERTLRLLDQQVDFSQYDQNRDGVVSRDELTVLPYFTHDKCRVERGGFGSDWDRYQTNDGVTLANRPGDFHYTSAHVYVGAPMWVFNHELGHGIFGGRDLYGETRRVDPLDHLPDV